MADSVRTVSVELKMKISDFEAGAAKAAATMKGLSSEVDSFGKSSKGGFNDASKASSNFTNNLKAASAGSRGLEFNLVNFGITAAPFLAPVAAGSVLGVLALGGVGAGILGQLKDPAVQVAAKSFTESVSGSLTSATTAFGPQIVKALGVAQTGVDNFIGDLKPAFDSLAPEAVKIAKDFTNGLAEAGPSLSKSLIAAEPDLEALSRLIGSLPADVASFASGLSAGAEGGAAAIDDLDNELKTLTADLGTGLGAVAQLYGAISKGTAFLNNASGKFGGLGDVVSTLWHGANDALNPINQVTHAATGLQKLLSFGGSSDKMSASVQGVGKASTAAAPPLMAVSNGMEAAGVVAGNSYPDIQAIGKSMQSMGEHAGTSTPAVEAIGKSMASMGEHASTTIPAVDAIGKSMTSMGEHAGTSNLATQALGFSVTSLGEHAGTSDPMVQAVGKSMQSMGEHAGTANLATQAVGFAVQSMGEHAGIANVATDAIGKSMQSLGEHSGSAIGQLNGADTAVQNMAPSAEATAGAFNDLAASISKSSNAALIAAGNELSVKQSYADFTKALKDNGKTFDENTQKGRDNTQGLLNALGPLQKQYQGQVDAGTATFDTTKKYDAQVDKLITLAQKNGLAASKADALRSSLEKVQGSYTATVTVKVRVAETQAQAQLLARSTGQRIASRWGGVYQPAADGLLTHAQVYAPANPGRFMIAEPQTGGEAFIPKFGNYGRSLSILKAAAGWYGAHVVPGGGRSSAGSGPINITITASDPQGKAFLAAARFAVQQNGSGVVNTFTPR